MSEEAPAIVGIAALAIDCTDPPELARWWRSLLGGSVDVDPEGVATLHTPDGLTTFQSFKFSSIETEVFMMIFRSGQPSYEMLDSTSGHPHSLCLSRCHR